MYEIHPGAVFSAKFWIVKIIYYVIAREWGVLVLSPCLHSSLIFPLHSPCSDCPHLELVILQLFTLFLGWNKSSKKNPCSFIGSKIECTSTQKWHFGKACHHLKLKIFHNFYFLFIFRSFRKETGEVR